MWVHMGLIELCNKTWTLRSVSQVAISRLPVNHPSTGSSVVKIVDQPVFEVSDWMGDRLRIRFEYWTGQLRA